VLQGAAHYVSDRAVVSALRRRIRAIGVSAPVVGGSTLAKHQHQPISRPQMSP